MTNDKKRTRKSMANIRREEYMRGRDEVLRHLEEHLHFADKECGAMVMRVTSDPVYNNPVYWVRRLIERLLAERQQHKTTIQSLGEELARYQAADVRRRETVNTFTTALAGLFAQAMEPLTSAPKNETITLVGTGPNKISVIMAVREITGLGLKEAKDLVEAVAMMPQTITRRECQAMVELDEARIVAQLRHPHVEGVDWQQWALSKLVAVGAEVRL